MSNLIIDYDLSVQPADDRDTRMRDAAPEMYELLKKLAQGYNSSQNAAHSHNSLLYFSLAAQDLLAKIDGGGE